MPTPVQPGRCRGLRACRLTSRSRTVHAPFTLRCILKQQTNIPYSKHRLGPCAQVTAYLKVAKGFVVAQLLHPLSSRSALLCLFCSFLVVISLLPLFFSQGSGLGPSACSLLTCRCTSDHVEQISCSVGCKSCSAAAQVHACRAEESTEEYCLRKLDAPVGA